MRGCSRRTIAIQQIRRGRRSWKVAAFVMGNGSAVGKRIPCAIISRHRISSGSSVEQILLGCITRRVGSDVVRRPGARARQRPAALVAEVETFYHVVMRVIVVVVVVTSASSVGHRIIHIFFSLCIIMQPRRTVKERTIEDIFGRTIHSRFRISSLQRSFLSGSAYTHDVKGVGR